MPKDSNPKMMTNKAASKPNEKSKGNETANIQNNAVVEYIRYTSYKGCVLLRCRNTKGNVLGLYNNIHITLPVR